MLGTRTNADEARRQPAQKRKPAKEPADERQRIAVAGRLAADNVAMNEYLHPLDQAHRPFAPSLDFLEICERDRTSA